MQSSARVVLNISGEIFETLEKTLSRYPQTLLGDITKRKCYFCDRSNQYFFNRNRQSFGAILYFYQSCGILSCPPEISTDIFETECHFFQLPNIIIDNMRNKKGLLLEEDDDDDDDAVYIMNDTYKNKLWNLMENSNTSYSARLFALFSLLMVFISVASTCVETFPEFISKSDNIVENPWSLIELILNIWFLLELLGRFLSCPNKISFCRSNMNIFDSIAVIPYFIAIIIKPEKVSSLGFLRILKIIRVIRLFKLSKHSKRLQIVGKIIQSSISDLQLLLLCLTMLMIFGGSLMYFVEGSQNPAQFSSIPESLWWAVQTVTTVGYGDITPVTFPGKLIASSFITFGALTISLPVLSIVTKFMTLYSTNED